MPKYKIRLFVGVYFIIALLCLFSYLNSLSNPFIWDDDAIVIKNTLIRDWRLWYKAFAGDLYSGTSSGSNFYRPLQTLYYLIDYHFWQLEPRGYHITNIFLQFSVSSLVFLLVYAFSQEVRISFATACLFAVAPIHTEAVTYISGRADLLLGLCLLYSLLLFIKSNYAQGKLQKIFLFLSLCLFIGALLSKELAVVFPLVILAFLFYYAKDSFKKRGYFIMMVLPFILIDIVYITFRFTLLKFPTSRLPALTKYPISLRIMLLPKIIFTYFKLLILPINLHMSRTLIRPVSFTGVFLSWVLLVIIFMVCIYILWYKKDKKITAFMLFWFLVFLLPQSGLFPTNAFVAEHFIYLSSISFFMLISYLLFKYLRKGLFYPCLAILIFSYGILTYSRNLEWKNPVVFYEKIVRFSPDSFQAHNNLGLEYEHRQWYNEAISEYKRAIEIMPDLLEAHSNLANLYFKQSRFKAAEEEYAIVEKIAPPHKMAEVQNNIGCVYEMQGLWDKALERYGLALRLDPRLNFTHFNLARIYLTKADLNLATEEIMASFSQVRLPKEKKQIYANLIKEYLKQIKKLYSAAIFYNDLGVNFAKGGLSEIAIPSFQMAIQLQPQYADAYFNLGLTFWKNGLKKQAVSELKTVLKINPHHPKAKGLLSQIVYQK